MNNILHVRLEERAAQKTHKLYKRYKRIKKSNYKNSIFVTSTKKIIHLRTEEELEPVIPTKFHLITPKYELLYTSEDMQAIFLDEQEFYYEKFPLRLQIYDTRRITTDVLLLEFKYVSTSADPCVEFRVLLTYTEKRYVPTQMQCIVKCENLPTEIPSSWYSQTVTNWYLFF